jgi:hypothetical protein
MTKINIEQICSITRRDKDQCYHYVYIEPYTIKSFFRESYHNGGFSSEYYIRNSQSIAETEREIAENDEIYIEDKTVYYKPRLIFTMSSEQRIVKYFESVQELEQFLKEEVLFHIKTINI